MVVMELNFEGEDGDDRGTVREERGWGLHRKDVRASGTPEVEATTSTDVEKVMGAAAKFKANTT